MGGVSGNNDESLIGGGGQRLVLYLGIHFTLDRPITWGCISIRERDDGV